MEWFRFLLEQHGLEFIIRIRCNCWVTLKDGRFRHLSLLTRNLPKGKTRIYEQVKLYDLEETVQVNLVCQRSAKGELVLLVTNRSDLNHVLDIYPTRWSIETAFGFLKSKGFDLEKTHLTKPKRIQLLLGVLSLCLLWALLVGVQEHLRKPITVKNHGRKTISFVRLGLDQLQDAIGNIFVFRLIEGRLLLAVRVWNRVERFARLVFLAWALLRERSSGFFHRLIARGRPPGPSFRPPGRLSAGFGSLGGRTNLR